MKKRRNSSIIVKFCLHMLGFALCIVPPLACALSYFPLWKTDGFASCIAGGGAVLLILSFVPLMKFLARLIKSYSSYVMWLIFFLLFFTLSRIAGEMTVISFVGFIGNLLGALCFKLASRKFGTEEEKV